jgi:hypothetical protein
MAHHPPPHAAPQDNAPLPAVSGTEAWRIVAPWLGYAGLGAAAVLGLFTASGAEDGATYDSGLVAAAVAIILIVWRMKQQLDGREIGFLLPVTPADFDTLAVTIAVLAVLGVVGGILAATVGGTLYDIGLALLIICAIFIFFEIKRYFDRREQGG